MNVPPKAIIINERAIIIENKSICLFIFMTYQHF